MSTLATLTALGILALTTAAAIAVTMARGAEQINQITPAGYDPAPAPTGDERRIRVNPDREPW